MLSKKYYELERIELISKLNLITGKDAIYEHCSNEVLRMILRDLEFNEQVKAERAAHQAELNYYLETHALLN